MSATILPADNMKTSLGRNPDIERLYDNVQSTVPAVTLPLIKIAAWNTIEEFALRSTYLRAEAFWQMAAGIGSVDFNPYSADMTVCWILSQQGLYRWRVSPTAELIDLQTPYISPRTGTALLALKPVSFDSRLPSEIWTNWFETILDGTLFRLYGAPAKPWSNTQLATYHGTRFRQGLNRARDTAARGYSNQQGSWSYPYFARGHRKQ